MPELVHQRRTNPPGQNPSLFWFGIAPLQIREASDWAST